MSDLKLCKIVIYILGVTCVLLVLWLRMAHAAEPNYVKDEIGIKFKTSATPEQIEQIKRTYKLVFKSAMPEIRWQEFTITDGTDPVKLATIICPSFGHCIPGVEKAEPNYIAPLPGKEK